MNAIKWIATSLISFWLVFLLTIPAAARDNSCRVTPHMERLSEITTPQQSFSGVLSDDDGHFKNIPFRVPAQSEVEITVIVTQTQFSRYGTNWRLEIRDADGKLVWFGASHIAWYYETSTATLAPQDPNYHNSLYIVRHELRGHLSFQTTRDLDINFFLQRRPGTGTSNPITYIIRTQVQRYGDHQFNIDAGTYPGNALPIVPGTTIRGHFPPSDWFFPAPTPLEPGVEVSPYYFDRSDLYVLKDVPLGTTLNARILDTKLRKPPGYRGYADQLGIEILQLGCTEDGHAYLIRLPRNGFWNSAGEEIEEPVDWSEWRWREGHTGVRAIADSLIATYSGDYYIALTRWDSDAKYNHPMEYAFIVETNNVQSPPVLVAEENEQAPVNLILAGIEFRMIDGHYPEEPPIGGPVLLGYRLRNLPDYWVSGLTLAFQFSDAETEEPINGVEAEMDEGICESNSVGTFICTIAEMPTGDHKDFLFRARMPESNIRWRAIWHLDDGSLDPGTATGIVESNGEPSIVDVIALADQKQERYGIPSVPYPFLEQGRKGLNYRTLFVVGYKLPQETGDDVSFMSPDPNVEYRFIAFPDTTNSFHKETYEAGWAAYRANNGLAPEDPLPDGLEGFLVRANLRRGIMPGIQEIQYGESIAPWELYFGGLEAAIMFVNEGNRGEIGTAYPPGYVEVLVTLNTPLPIEEISINVYEDQRSKSSAKTHKIIARLDRSDPSLPPVYRTPPILLTDPANPSRPPVGPDTLAIPVSLNGPGPVRLRAEVEGSFRAKEFSVPMLPAMAQIDILNDPRDERIAIALNADPNVVHPKALFNQALQVAAACKNISITNFDSLDLLNREADYFWNVVLLEFFDEEIRTTPVTIGHHAAILLLRNLYVELLEQEIHEIRRIESDDKLVLAFLKRMSAHFGERNFPINRIEVTAPDGQMIEYRYAGAFDNDEFLAQQYGLGEGDEGRKKAFEWRLDATREALGKLRKQSADILTKARQLDTCEDIEKLVRLTGSGFRVIVQRLEPMLRELTQMSDSVRGTRWTAWERDPEAVFWLNEVKPLLKAVHRQESRAQEDTMQLLFAGLVVSGVTAAIAASTMPYLAFAVGASDLAATSYVEISAYISTNAEVEFSEKAAIVLKYERNAEAERVVKHWASMMVPIGMSAGFAALDGVQLAVAISKVKNVARGMEATRSLATRDIKSLSRSERRNVALFAMRARMRQVTRGLGALTDLERRAIAEIEALVRLEQAATVALPGPTGTSRILRPANNVDIVIDLEKSSYRIRDVEVPRASSANDFSPIMRSPAADVGSDGFYIRLSDLEITPGSGTGSVPPGGGSPASAPVLHPEHFGPGLDNTILTFRNARGQNIRLRLGNYMASGSFSSVLRESLEITDPKILKSVLERRNESYSRVVKITFEYPPDFPGGQRYNSFLADEAGRDVILSMPLDKNIRVPRRAPPDVHRVRLVEEASLPPSAIDRMLVVQIMERVPESVNRVWQELGGRLGRWRAEGTFRGLRDLNNHGAAWLDNKVNNFSLESVEGTVIPRMVVFDTGGIIQMKGSTLEIRAARAQQVQRLVNGPFDDFLQQQMEKYRWRLVTVHPALRPASVRLLTIQELFGELVKLEPLGIKQFEELFFNPSAGDQLPDVRNLFENYGIPIRSADDVIKDIPQ